MFRESLFDLLNRSETEVKYNCRVKSRRLSDGSLEPLEIMICNRYIFNPDGCKESELSFTRRRRLEYEEAAAELFWGVLPSGGRYQPDPTPECEKIARSKRRAKGKLMDLILANDFDCFVTLTLDGDKIDRYDYAPIIKKLNTWLDNRVRRSGLYYVGVPECHKDGAIHFHFLCNSSGLRLVDSGTISCDGRKKPIKISTADRLHIPLEQRHTVFNIPDWALGHSTAIMTYGERSAVANYVGKYVTKGDKKIGGRWYYSGGKLDRLVCTYQRVDFDSFTEPTYEFKCDGGEFKVVKFD